MKSSGSKMVTFLGASFLLRGARRSMERCCGMDFARGAYAEDAGVFGLALGGGCGAVLVAVVLGFALGVSRTLLSCGGSSCGAPRRRLGVGRCRGSPCDGSLVVP